MIPPVRLSVVFLLVAQALMLGTSAALHAPVMDDIAHLAAGISNWELGRFDLYNVNPPLVRMVAALPVLAAGAKTDYGSYSQGVGVRAEFNVMDAFVRANGERIIWLVTLARCGLIPLSLLGGYVCYRWARELYGDTSGMVALVVWCFCPNVLANSQILAADAGAAALGVTAAYFFWKWLRDPAWDRALLAGIVLGLAELTKTTWVVLFGLWPVLWFVVRCPWSVGRSPKSKVQRSKSGEGSGFGVQGSENPKCEAGNPKSRRFGYELVQLATILALGVFCINAGYDFEGSGTKLRNYLFLSRPLTGVDAPHGPSMGNRFATSWLGTLPVPLPKNYIEGIDLQWHDIEAGKPSYLHGRWKDRGWWYWYLYALAVKVPLGTWGLLLLAVGVRIANRRHHAPRDGFPHATRSTRVPGEDYGGRERFSPKSEVQSPKSEGSKAQSDSGRPYPSPLAEGEGVTWRDELVLLAPALVVLVLVSSQTGFSRYIRYLLPMFPFVFIWISSVARDIGSVRHIFGAAPRNATEGVPYRRRWTVVVAGALLAWSVGSSLWYAPHWMSYFNELAGGPMGGPRHLIDAQVDWGQDLLFLKKWYDAHPEACPLGVVYFGPINPTLAGVDFALPPKGIVSGNDRIEIAGVPEELKPGWYAISVNFLYGYDHYIYNPSGSREWVTRPYYSYFRRFQPVATAGYSIYIYHLTASDIAAADQATR